MKLKDKYKLTDQEKEKIKELNGLFFENEHELLRGGRLSIKVKREIDELYYKYLDNITFNWSTTLLEAEIENLKKDSICKGNTNKNYWIKSYLLSWLSNLPDVVTLEYLYDHLTTREANRQLISKAYEL